MGARQSFEVTRALEWLRRKPVLIEGKPVGAKRTVKDAAKRFGVHETTLWRALGKQKAK